LQYSHLLYLFTFNIYFLVITQSVIFFINSFTMKYKTKIKLYRDKKPSVKEYISDCQLLYSKYCLQVEISPANMTIYVKGSYGFETQCSACWVFSFLKDHSQPLLFSMPTKLLILHGEVKSCCFTASCVP